MGDGVNIAARLEGVAKPGRICLSEDAYRHVKGRLDLAAIDLGPIQDSRTSPSRSAFIRSKSAYSLGLRTLSPNPRLHTSVNSQLST